MADSHDEFEKWVTDVIFGRARGFRASLARIFLSALSVVFRVLVKLRLWLIQHGWRESTRLSTAVVSIGNLTMGGTGKTPVVELLARELGKRGRKIAILSRGYKSQALPQAQHWQHPRNKSEHRSPPKIVSDGQRLLLDVAYAGDEPYMLAKNLPGVAVVVDRNRARGGRFAVGQLNCDTLLLDDGMQNFGLAHSLDIVLIDQGSPFGVAGMIPRGTLREPPSHIKRADYVFITKCDGSSNVDLISRISRYNQRAQFVECTHGPKHLEGVFTGEIFPLKKLSGLYVAAISGIAIPESFDRLLNDLGAQVEFHTTFSDHHAFSQEDIDKFMSRCLRRGIEMIVTTEKDAVRFPPPSEPDIPIFFLRIEVEILEGQKVFQACLDRICQAPDHSTEDWAEARLLNHEV